MKAPAIFVIVGWNRREGDLVAWFFDEHEADHHAESLNEAAGDAYAYKVERCDPAHGVAGRRP